MADPFDAFNSAVMQSDPYAEAAAPILGTQLNTKTWTPNQTFAGNAIQAFLGTALKGMALHDEAQQRAKVAEVLPALYANPTQVPTPLGVNSDAFNTLRLGAAQQNENTIEGIQKSAIGQLFAKDPDMARAALGLPPETSTPLPLPNASTQMTTQEKMKRYFLDNVNTGMPPTQAASAAKEQVAAEIKASGSTFTNEEKARQAAEQLRAVSDKVGAAIDSGVYTGTGGTLNNLGNRVLGSLGSSQSAQEAANADVFTNIIPQVIAAGRPPGVRLTEMEWSALVNAKPSLNKTPEENKRLNMLWRAAADQQARYADLLASAREAGGTQSDADRVWNEVSKVPLFTGNANTGDITINPKRPDWTDVWDPSKPFPSAFAKPQSAQKPDLASFIAEAKANGWTKDEARKHWQDLGGQ